MPILKAEFFEKSAIKVAQELIGCYLVRKNKSGRIEKFLIVETESYEGLEDLASHASKGKTKRNEIMFGNAGHWYVYFTYGMHYMLNIVCGPKNHPAAVLIRGAVTKEVVKTTHSSRPSCFNKEEKKECANLKDQNQNLIGPARLTKKLGIDKSFNGKIAGKKTGLWIEKVRNYTKSHGREKVYDRQKFKILKTPRIGVSYAGQIWSKKLYRFVLPEFETKKFKRI